MKNAEMISALLRPNIRGIAPYSTARDDCKAAMEVYMDANESPYSNGVNRYPSPHQEGLKERLSVLKSVPVGNIFLGNGSDEAIDLIFRAFCQPGASSMIQIVPTYGMYSVSAAINDVRVIDCPLDGDFALSSETLLSKVEDDTKVVFICSPNNPTGNLLDRGAITDILEKFSGIVVVDEAYIDFSSAESLSTLIGKYPRLIVLQTLSKAWGMAGLRIGLAIADEFIVEVFSKIKYPYNISVLNQKKAEELLAGAISVRDRIEETVSERERMASALSVLPCVIKVYPSDANFLLVRFNDKDAVFNTLLGNGIIVRDRSSVPGCGGCLRISIGTREENNRLLQALGVSAVPCDPSVSCDPLLPCDPSVSCAALVSSDPLVPSVPAAGSDAAGQTLSGQQGRQASVMRNTSETAVSVRVNLDRFRKPSVSTGLNFFNHMLEQIAYHGNISLDIVCFGDIRTDDHHTVEDVAMALGDCLKTALGDKKGISRYGFCLPMDEAEAFVLLDLGGRIDFLWDVGFSSEKIGDVSSQMFRHFFKTLSEHLCCNLHIKAHGLNDHHVIEGVFKAFARTLRSAVAKTEDADFVPSTKGMI